MYDIQNFMTIRWESLIAKKVIYQYFKDRDIKELAYTSKDVLNQLSSVLLRRIHISKQHNGFTNKLLQISRAEHHNGRYNLRAIDTVKVSYKIAKLEYINLFNYLCNVKILNFTALRFEIDYINPILNNLLNLKVLELTRIKLFAKLSIGVITGEICLQVPLTLDKLVLKFNKSEIVNDMEDPSAEFKILEGIYTPLDSISKLKFKNLKKLIVIESSESENPNRLVINQYLVNNPSLKSLATEYNELSASAFSTLAKSKSLNYLTLGNFKRLLDFKNIKFKAINSIKFLSLDESFYIHNFKHIQIIIEHLPNINYLKLVYESNNFNKMQILVSKLPNLNSLVLLAKKRAECFNVNFNNDSLRKINLVNFKLDKLDLKRLDNLRNLKTLKLVNYSYDSVISEEVQRERLKKLGWNSIFISRSINCSRD
ncbi:hypothetical protein CONCODRAFT_69134 [Conidiobolus coronatus NRRL 28638]|uniref:RNI-like protein n=1 Tax=Conidiobolus coronatus (strain ATCC 28846 / CBS 209.66 / NRRL 28638) TaxID=796925 RepID=A0A137PBF8_CONC2|nr:hypothetical protein CONCODRAFT_69134 [Conidiobolus coronatus NRRL 28638]|eukprot:KXN72350.1 hypothetical protein CONCODRAFT_69134 [Conidiobolus coronatus NRRL 28638]